MDERKRKAGKKGGMTTFARYGRAHFSKIGKRGAIETWRRYMLAPYGTSRYAMVERETGKVVAIR